MFFFFLQKIIDKTASTFRKCVIRERVRSCGSNLSVYGKVYLVNSNISIGNNVKLYPGIQFFGNGPISIGDNVSIGNNVMVYASEGAGIEICDNTNIAAQCYLVDMDHGMRKGTLIRNQTNNVSRICIGKDVWIGANATILKGVKIGDGAVVGAKSLVNKNIDENVIVVGVPAHVIRNRKD